MLDQAKAQVRDAPQVTAPTRGAIQPAGTLLQKTASTISREGNMGMVMVKCPQSGRAIPTGIKIDRESFGRSAVFFSRTHCPICNTYHDWFAREAWVHEPSIRTQRFGTASSA
jgi:hypothetical protein